MQHTEQHFLYCGPNMPLSATHHSTLAHDAILQHSATYCNTLRHICSTLFWIHQTCRKMDEGNTLQHTATHCNTLQHTATHCNKLQHTATHCNTRNKLQHTATHCNTLPHTRMRAPHHQHSLQHTATHCNILQHTALHRKMNRAPPHHHCSVQCVLVCCSVLQCVAVCCHVLQCVAVCCSVLQCVAACVKCSSSE